MKMIIKQEGKPQTVIEYLDPLRDEIPPVDFNNPLSRRCDDIIIGARLIWGYNSIPASENEIIDWKRVPKKKSIYINSKISVAMDICYWYQRESLLFLRSGFQVDNTLLKTNIEDCRKGAKVKVGENISDQQICAIFAICEAFDAIRSMQQGKPEEAIKEKVLSASMFLKLAKEGFEPEKQASNPKAICFPIPSGIEISGVKMVFLDDENVRITINGESRSFHYVEMGFSHKVNKEPLEMWNTLLEYAEYNGVLRSVVYKKQKDSERINERLKSFFVTNDDLIRANKTVFNISRKTGKKQKPINIQSKECPSCHETHRHFCFTCKDEQEHCKECHDELYKETHTELSK